MLQLNADADHDADAGVLAVFKELRRRNALKLHPSSKAELGAALGGISKQAVSKWHRVPPDRVLEIERILGISRHVLRGDVFGPAKKIVRSANVRKRKSVR